jgi:hypothetical protein
MEDMVEADRRNLRPRGTAEADADEKLLSVDELGVDGLMREGTSVGSGGEDERRTFRL